MRRGLRNLSVLDKKLDKEADTARVPEKGALIRPEGEERVHRYGRTEGPEFWRSSTFCTDKQGTETEFNVH